MAGINFDVSGTTANAVMQTLITRKTQLLEELEEIERGIAQLGQIAAEEKDGAALFKRSNYGVAETRIRELLMKRIPVGATVAEIVQECDISRATAYRLIKEMVLDRQIQTGRPGYWVLNPTYQPRSK
ncbi:MAG TPA: hypothetical protein VIJ19_10585 [Opitutaceae bacterium]